MFGDRIHHGDTEKVLKKIGGLTLLTFVRKTKSLRCDRSVDGMKLEKLRVLRASVVKTPLMPRWSQVRKRLQEGLESITLGE